MDKYHAFVRQLHDVRRTFADEKAKLEAEVSVFVYRRAISPTSAVSALLVD